MAFMKANGIEAELRDRDVGDHEAERIARGGKRQTPNLVDTETGEEMYDSEANITSLKKRTAT